jgi:hypothetical protein
MWWSPWHPNGARLGPVLVDDPDDMAAVLSAGVAAASSLTAAVDVVSTFVPASLAALPQLLRAGFAIVDSDLLMATDAALLDPRRYVPTVDTP